MRYVVRLLYLLAVATTARSSLLEMSQTLWNKALAGGLTKIGILDPLIIPVIKVDQSEGKINYRMILRSVEIGGLNSSRLESIKLARGRLRANLSESEAGYVSYDDRNQLDMIRYRFHTVLKEPKIEDQSQDYRVRPHYNEDRPNYQGRRRHHHHYPEYYGPYHRRNHDRFSRYRDENAKQEAIIDDKSTERTIMMSIAGGPTDAHHEQDEASASASDDDNNKRRLNPAASRRYYQFHAATGVQSAYADTNDADDGNKRNEDINRGERRNFSPYPIQLSRDKFRTESSSNRYDDGSGVINTGRNRIAPNTEAGDTKTHRRCDENNERNPAEGDDGETSDGAATSSVINFDDPRTNNGNRNGNDDGDRYASTFDKVDNNESGPIDEYREKSFSERVENQPGYVDILYASDKDKKVNHFANLKFEPGNRETTSVYSIQDVLRDLRDQRRFIIHNFTEGEALTKKNDALRTASESKRIKDLVRYAKEFQEKNGYYEEGMEFIYHYGAKEKEGVILREMMTSDSRRTKRAHIQQDNDDEDIMHVILKISVPTLRVDAGYVLSGKVGDRPLRGNGQLSANFTELIGDFALELKKVDNDTMIVRAARAKLTSKDKRILLQGMDVEEGPVTEILTQGLLAAEAVAAMLADDLTTKALTEKTADSIIYRMYKDLPTEN